MNITIVGSTGNVGRKIIEVLEKKNFPVDNLYLVASSKSAGSKLKFKGKEMEVENLETFDFSKGKITFISAGGKISEKYAAKAAEHSTVIDNSSHFRMDPDVPLIVPQVNSNDLKKIKKNADLILASNVFAHSDKLKLMAECMLKLIKKNGTIIIEVQYLMNTLKDVTFDNIYHEHYNYWSLISLVNFFNNFNWCSIDQICRF